MSTPLFPGATEFSLVSLYGDRGTNCSGGTPHLHTACTEAYVGIKGNGSVEVLSAQGHAKHPVGPGQVVWFSPGVIHRGLPQDEPVDVLVLMQNAGLPEAGDAVLTLPSRFWDQPESYRDTVSIQADTTQEQERLVLRRRELAVEGFAELLERCKDEGPSGLDPFFEYARQVVAPRLDTMVDLVNRTAASEVAATVDALASMASGSISHFHNGQVGHTTNDDVRFGMCGMLKPFRSNSTST